MERKATSKHIEMNDCYACAFLGWKATGHQEAESSEFIPAVPRDVEVEVLFPAWSVFRCSRHDDFLEDSICKINKIWDTVVNVLIAHVEPDQTY